MASKTIRVDEAVHARLEQMRDWKQTMSDVVKKLLDVHDTLQTASDLLGPSHYLKSKTPQGKGG